MSASDPGSEDSYGIPDPDIPIPEEVYTKFYELIGLCIKTWAEIETCIFAVCALSLQAPEKQTTIVFYRTPTIETRLELTNELASAFLPPKDRPDGGHDHPLVTKLAKLSKKIRDLLPVRNQIAHAPATKRTFIKVLLPTEEEPKARVVPSHAWLQISPRIEEILHRGRGIAPIRKEELEEHLQALRELVPQMEAFIAELGAMPTEQSPPSSPEPSSYSSTE